MQIDMDQSTLSETIRGSVADAVHAILYDHRGQAVEDIKKAIKDALESYFKEIRCDSDETKQYILDLINQENVIGKAINQGIEKITNQESIIAEAINQGIEKITNQESVMGRAIRNAITEGFDNLPSLTQYTADFTIPAIILGAAAIFCCLLRGH